MNDTNPYSIPDVCDSESGEHWLYVRESGWYLDYPVTVVNGRIESENAEAELFPADDLAYYLDCYDCGWSKEIPYPGIKLNEHPRFVSLGNGISID